jgi:hypothetical protein
VTTAARGARVRRGNPERRSRDEGGRATYRVPDAAVQAPSGGLRRVLICSGDLECRRWRSRRWCTPSRRAEFRGRMLEDALPPAAGEGALSGADAGTCKAGVALHQVVGCDAHRRIADRDGAVPLTMLRAWQQRANGQAAGRAPGDRIAVVAPASPFPRGARARRGRAPAARVRTGLRRVLFAHDRGTWPEVHATRADAFMRVLDRSQRRGAHRGPRRLRKRAPSAAARAAGIGRYPKLFIGYSDTRRMLSWLTCQCGIPALHGPMLEGRSRSAWWATTSLVHGCCCGGEGTLELEPEGRGGAAWRRGRRPAVRGHDGAADCVARHPYAFDPPEGCVLFLEDVNERPYRIDRMLTQLSLSGVSAEGPCARVR